jgi:hypothetical protein
MDQVQMNKLDSKVVGVCLGIFLVWVLILCILYRYKVKPFSSIYYFPDPMTGKASATPKDWLKPKFDYGVYKLSNPIPPNNEILAVISNNFCKNNPLAEECAIWLNMRKRLQPYYWPNTVTKIIDGRLVYVPQ